MPFDGTYLDEATQVLIQAKQVLIDTGWTIYVRLDEEGQRCALGAIDAAIGVEWTAGRGTPAVIRLADAIPDCWCNSVKGADNRIAVYNNSQVSIEPILDWFDRAIAVGVK